MKILHFTDLHGNLSGIENIEDEIRNADLIVLSGDITHFEHKEEAKKIVKTFHEINKNILAVTGNCDYKDVLDYLEEDKMNLEGQLHYSHEFDFFGLGGSLYTPFNTPNEYDEDYYKTTLDKLKSKVSGKPLIIVSHQPPYNTDLDKIMAVMHVGSKSLREAIEEHEPVLCLCGHIHEATGIDKIGKTKIVNPGPWRSKNYAIIEIEGNEVDIQISKA